MRGIYKCRALFLSHTFCISHMICKIISPNVFFGIFACLQKASLLRKKLQKYDILHHFGKHTVALINICFEIPKIFLYYLFIYDNQKTETGQSKI